MKRGMPIYLIGKSTIWQGNKVLANWICYSSQRMGAIWHLATLHPRPEAFSNIVKMTLVICRSEVDGLKNVTKSSAYMDARNGI
jgi:hypothetical protein